jgi:hypothetical protein
VQYRKSGARKIIRKYIRGLASFVSLFLFLSLFLSPSLPLAYHYHHIRIQQENVYLKRRRGPSPRTPHAGAMIWGSLPASRTVRNKCVLFKPPSLWMYGSLNKDNIR